MLLIKTWLENRINEMSEIESRRNLPPATRTLLIGWIRHGKGLLLYLENWLKEVSK